MSVKALLSPVLVLFACSGASAQQVDCPDLQAVLATADVEFAPLRGKLNLSVMPGAVVKKPAVAPALLDFEEHIYETTRPLRGASHCQIRAARLNDAAVALQKASYRCAWSSNAGFAALKQSLSACIVNPVDRQEAPESLHLYVQRVSSGEGDKAVFVAVETHAARKMVLNVSRVVCLNRSTGGCDEKK